MRFRASRKPTRDFVVAGLTRQLVKSLQPRVGCTEAGRKSSVKMKETACSIRLKVVCKSRVRFRASNRSELARSLDGEGFYIDSEAAAACDKIWLVSSPLITLLLSPRRAEVSNHSLKYSSQCWVD